MQLPFSNCPHANCAHDKRIFFKSSNRNPLESLNSKIYWKIHGFLQLHLHNFTHICSPFHLQFSCFTISHFRWSLLTIMIATAIISAERQVCTCSLLMHSDGLEYFATFSLCFKLWWCDVSLYEHSLDMEISLLSLGNFPVVITAKRWIRPR